MIDIDLLDERLVNALDDDLRLIRRGEAPPAPVAAAAAKPAKGAKGSKSAAAAAMPPTVIPPTADDAERITLLLRQGRLAEADNHIAMHAALALESRDAHRRHDAATWETMRALLDGNETKARTSLASARVLGTEAHDADTMDRHWIQRFWMTLEWGGIAEQLELLDHCRERAYRFDDLEWRAPLTLALARLGRSDEALREFDLTFERLRNAARVDLMSILAEAAAFLGNVERSGRIQRHLEGAPAQLVVLGRGWVCTGALARYQAHAAAGMGEWALADDHFKLAVELHRELQAQPLLARTLREWGCSLVGRDNTQARRCLTESDQIAARLRLAGLVTPTQALPAA